MNVFYEGGSSEHGRPNEDSQDESDASNSLGVSVRLDHRLDEGTLRRCRCSRHWVNVIVQCTSELQVDIRGGESLS